MSEPISSTFEPPEHDVWPPDVLAAFGTWDDVADPEELRRTLAMDVPPEADPTIEPTLL